MGGAKPGQGTVTVEGVRLEDLNASGLRPQCLTIRMEIDRCLNRNPIATALSIPTRRTHEVPTKRGSIATRRSPLPPRVEQTDVSSVDSMARQRAPVGNPLNNEQRSDHLSDPLSH